MRMVAAREDSPLATPCTMTEETRELARGSPGDPARSGGRLKFFKDGKFILELVRSGGSGEGGGWVSVPRKTFWPPAAAAAPTGTPSPAHHARTERAASLSVSDDNSSLQSSPWQRDHCWKQTTPRKNISKELTLYYCRPSTLLRTSIAHASRTKRRRPHDTTNAQPLSNGAKHNGVCADSPRNGSADVTDGPASRTDDAGDGNSDSTGSSTPANNEDTEVWNDRERYYHMKLKKPYQYHKLKAYKTHRPYLTRPSLLSVIDKLRDKMAALPAPVNAKLASCRQEHAMVSPRKRILREMERVTLEDQGGKRRAKTAPALSTTSYPPSPGPSHASPRPPDTPPARANGSARRDAHKVTNYSIHSLLSMPDDSPPDSKRYTPSIKTESPSSVRSPDLSPSPDHYRYRHSLALGSPDSVRVASSSQQGRSRASPHAPVPQYRGSPGHDLPHQLPPTDWRDSLYPYGTGYASPFLPPHVYRAAPPPPPPPHVPWLHYLPPGPWAPLHHPLVTHHIPKEEPSSDMPLNLSKH